MTQYLGDTSRERIRHVGKEQRLCTMVIVCNGSGGVTSVTGDDPACGATDGGANGDLDFTFPAFAKGQVFPQLVSAAGTVDQCYFSALDVTAGTGTLITLANATATDPASGDEIHLEIWGTVAP